MPFPGPQGLFYKMGMGPSPKKALRAPSWPVPPTAFWGATAGGPALSHTLPGPGGSARLAAPTQRRPRGARREQPASVEPGGGAGERPASREAGRRETARRQGAIRRRPAGGPSPAPGMTEAALKHPAAGGRGLGRGLPPPGSHPWSSRWSSLAVPLPTGFPGGAGRGVCWVPGSGASGVRGRDGGGGRPLSWGLPRPKGTVPVWLPALTDHILCAQQL